LVISKTSKKPMFFIKKLRKKTCHFIALMFDISQNIDNYDYIYYNEFFDFLKNQGYKTQYFFWFGI
jgi:hypothetical protein